MKEVYVHFAQSNESRLLVQSNEIIQIWCGIQARNVLEGKAIKNGNRVEVHYNTYYGYDHNGINHDYFVSHNVKSFSWEGDMDLSDKQFLEKMRNALYCATRHYNLDYSDKNEICLLAG